MAQTTPRWRIALPLIAVVVLFAIWSAWWWWASSFAQSKFAEARQLQADRLRIDCSNESWGGYPYRILFTCRGPHITLRKSGTQIFADRLDILAHAYNPTHIIARLTGPTRIANPAKAVSLEAVHLPAVTGVKLSGGRLKIATSRVKNLTLRDRAIAMTADEIVLHARPANTPRTGIDFALQAAGLAATPSGAPAVTLDVLTGQANLDKLPARTGGTFEMLLRALADSGSTMTIDRLEAGAGQFKATASGSASIARNGLVTGTIKTIINDPAPVMSGLQERGLLSKKQASTAGALLGLFKTEQGVSADLRLKDGKIYWGPLKLGQHAPLF